MADASVVYIDFEGRIDVAPVLLGELWPGQDGSSFRQWVMGPELKSAAAAQPHVKAASLEEVAQGLLGRAGRQDASIVAWSSHEREVLKQFAGLVPAELSLLAARYVNAITQAKAWRRKVLPTWDPPEESLKKYFIATGYRTALARRVTPQPAKWIKDTQAHVSSKGSYRKLGPKVKQKWQRLLTYNEDDCRGLRHVYQETGRQLQLWKAYEATTFVVDADGGPVNIRVNQRGKRLRRLLDAKKASTWAFISAWNPDSQALSKAQNEERHGRLLEAVQAARLTHLTGRGVPADEAWPPEESLMVFGVSEGKAVSLGRTFGQLAVVWGRRDEPARLLSCRPVPRELVESE